MTNITLTKENFWKKIWIIYQELLNNSSIKIKLEKPEKKLIWTEYEEKSYNEAKKDLENWNTTRIDFSKIKTEDDFISLLKS